LGWGQTQRFVSWVAWEGEVWLFLKEARWDLKEKSWNYFFGGVEWGVVGERGLIFYFSFVI